MLSDLEKIKIGCRYFKFKLNDPIFKITEAVGPKKNEN